MNKTVLRFLLVVLLLPAGCGDDDQPGQLTAVSDEAAGANCANGGVRVDVGIDDDGDGALAAAEIDSTTYVCHGSDGVGYLTNVAVEPAGANCAAGGLLIEVGPDSDGDGALSSSEVESSSYVCNGVDGEDGVGYITRVSPESAGGNCATGGLRVETGPDSDGSGTLDPGEVADTSYVCNGVNGVGSTLTTVSVEAAGANCDAGGVRIDAGADDNGNGFLDSGEIDDTQYVCNGASQLVDTAVESPGTNCPLGGLRIQTGTDDDGNGTLEPAEVDNTSYVCDGGTGQVVTVFNEVLVAANTGESLTLQQATIDVPAPGQIWALGTADAFCYAPAFGGGYDCSTGTPAADGCISVRDDPAAEACPSNLVHQSYFWLNANTSLNVSRNTVFTVPSAGSYTYYLRGKNAHLNPGEVGYWRRQLTLIYIPD